MLTLVLATVQNDARALWKRSSILTQLISTKYSHHLLLLSTPSYLLFDPALSLSFISLNHRRKEQE